MYDAKSMKAEEFISHEEITAGAEGDTAVIAEAPSEGRAGALGPGRFVIARHDIAGFSQPFEDSAHTFQFGIAAHVAQVARHDHEIARRSVDFPNGRTQQGVGFAAGRYMDVGQEGEAEFRSFGQNTLRSTPGLHSCNREQGGSHQKKDSFHGVFFDTAR